MRLAFCILVFSMLAIAGCSSSVLPASSQDVPEGAVVLSWGKFNYNPEVIRVKKDVPVTIFADTERLTGCFRSIVVPELGIRKFFTEQDRVLRFTPEKAGTFGFGCTMGMGGGRLVVE